MSLLQLAPMITMVLTVAFHVSVKMARCVTRSPASARALWVSMVNTVSSSVRWASSVRAACTRVTVRTVPRATRSPDAAAVRVAGTASPVK